MDSNFVLEGAESKEMDHDLAKADSKLIKSRKSLYIMGSTFMLCYAAYEGVIGLESSINVEEGLGTTSVMVIFITSSISCILFVPFIVDYFGAKTATIVGEIGVAVYIAANFYPSWYTLIPAAIFHGLTESCPWAGASVYVTYLGQQRWRKRRSTSIQTKEKPKKSYIYQFFGHFFSFVYMGNIIGYGMISVVMMGFKSVGEKYESTSTHDANNVTEMMHLPANFTPTSPDHLKLNPLEKCGASDCQAEYIHNGTEEELEKFNPNPISIYLLLTIFLTMSTVAIVIQAVFLPRAPAKYDKKERNPGEAVELRSTEIDKTASDEVPSVRNDIIDVLKRTIRHIVSPIHLLSAPILFYQGMYYAYYVTEYTRAFVSCTVGVEQLGIGLSVIGVSAVISSNLSAWLITALGRKWFLVVICGTHMAVYLFSLFWLPNPANSWMTYLLAVIVGVAEANITNFAQSITALYFHDRVGVGFSVKNCITNLGIVAATGWSTSLCVYVKIYLHMGILIISLLSIVGAEALFKRKLKSDIEIAL